MTYPVPDSNRRHRRVVAVHRTQGAVSKMESGEIRLDPIELQRLAALYRVKVEALLPGGKKLEEG